MNALLLMSFVSLPKSNHCNNILTLRSVSETFWVP